MKAPEQTIRLSQTAAKVQSILDRIHVEVRDRERGAMGGEKHWGHVGDLTHAAEGLGEVARFLGC